MSLAAPLPRPVVSSTRRGTSTGGRSYSAVQRRLRLVLLSACFHVCPRWSSNVVSSHTPTPGIVPAHAAPRYLPVPSSCPPRRMQVACPPNAPCGRARMPARACVKLQCRAGDPCLEGRGSRDAVALGRIRRTAQSVRSFFSFPSASSRADHGPRPGLPWAALGSDVPADRRGALRRHPRHPYPVLCVCARAMS